MAGRGAPSPRWIANRIGQMLVVMWIVGTVVFFVFRVLPGDQVSILLGIEGQSEEAREALNAQLGLDQPMVVQYASWLGNVVQGDLGIAHSYGGVTVTSLIGGALLRTVELATAAMLIGILTAIPLGIAAARRAGTVVDHATRGLAVIGFSLPSFWLGILLILLLSVVIPIFPSGGFVPFLESPLEHMRHLILPAVTVGVITSGVLVRFVRSSMIEVRQEDFVRAARARGVSEHAINYRHSLKNTGLTLVTVIGIQFGLMLGGMVVVEQVFGWPGIGWLTVQALELRDYSVVQGAVLVSAAVFVLVNTVVDIAYSLLDPRVEGA